MTETAPKLFQYHVTYFYLATGMEGVPDTRDLGIVSARSEEDARRKAAEDMTPSGDKATIEWTMGCLTTRMVPPVHAPRTEPGEQVPVRTVLYRPTREGLRETSKSQHFASTYGGAVSGNFAEIEKRLMLHQLSLAERAFGMAKQGFTWKQVSETLLSEDPYGSADGLAKKQTVHVVMGNDYPESVFSEEAAARRYVLAKTQEQRVKSAKERTPSPRVYWSMYSFEVRGDKT